MKTLLCLATLILAVACGDTVDPEGNGPDAAPEQPDANDSGCTLPPQLGTLNLVQQAARSVSTADSIGDPQMFEASGYLNDLDPPDRFVLQLFDNTDQFPQDQATGTFDISLNDNFNYQTCGVCVRIVADWVGVGATEFERSYLATSGTVTIDSLTPNLSGSITDVIFHHVLIDDTTLLSTQHPDFCETFVASATFSAVTEDEVQVAPSDRPTEKTIERNPTSVRLRLSGPR
jgi:hypothetical protein